MKIRQGFVSNSSSSSFVIARAHLSEEQIDAIKNHFRDYKLTQMNIQGQESDLRDWDEWNIDVDDDFVNGSTTMDNFDMKDYLKNIGIPDSLIKWGS